MFVKPTVVIFVHDYKTTLMVYFVLVDEIYRTTSEIIYPKNSFLIQSLALLKDFKYISCNDGTLTIYYKVVVRKFYLYLLVRPLFF